MEQVLLWGYVFTGLFIGWFYTFQMIKKDFERNNPLDSLAAELALMIICWVFYTVAGMFWPFMVLWWAFRKAVVVLKRVNG